METLAIDYRLFTDGRDYSVPGAKEDYIPQTTPPSEVAHTEVEKT